MDGRGEFGAEVRRARQRAGLSLADLAALVPCHRGYLHRVETGERWPSGVVARGLDVALGARGVLASLWAAHDGEERQAAVDARAVAASVRDSDALAALLDGGSRQVADAALGTADGLGREYLSAPPAPMLARARAARALVLDQAQRTHRPGAHRDLVRAAGYLSGVLAYAALDLGHPQAAAAHSRAAWGCGETVGDDALRAWTRGTQSLIARFAQDYPTALELARDGLDYAGAGTSTPRLWSGVAQSAANLGDRAQAHRALSAAEAARDAADGDELGGVFAFPPAKLAYYGGSALIWLDQPADARRAAASAAQAIELWRTGDPDDRSADDEALAHVYAATAHVQLGDLDAAADYLAPVLELPVERRISWLVKRTERVGELLAEPRLASSAQAETLHAAVAEFGADLQPAVSAARPG